MRIGVIASPWVPVPPPAYGGTEAVVNNLCVGLERRGHEVYLVTIGDSTCPVTRITVFDHPPAAIGEASSEIVQARAAYALFQDVDVIHDHTTLGPQFLPDTTHVPVVTTVHGPFWPETRMMQATRPSNLSLVAISHAQRAMAPEVDVEAVIHHGIDLDLYSPGPGGGGYLMFIGRMSPDKGPDRAIEVARRAGMPLVLAAKMRESGEVTYFEQQVRPLLGPDITFLGEADIETRLDLLRRAEALVNPIRWPEPFGLVMAEALACSTPVIALPYGAAPEIVDDGTTGFLCDDIDDMVAAVGRLDRIDRAACRQAAAERFSVDRMAADHEALYERLVERARTDRADDLAPAGVSATSFVDAVAEPGGRLAMNGRPALEGIARAATTVTSFDPARARGRRRFGPRRRPLGSLGPAVDPVAEH